jgi:chemotaxis protein CheX
LIEKQTKWYNGNVRTERPKKSTEPIIHVSARLREVDVEFVNPFLTAIHDTLKSMGQTVAQKGTLSLIKADTLKGDALIFLRVEGAVKGIVVLELPGELVKKFVSLFLLGVPIVEIDEMAKNSLAEFSIRISEIARRKLLKQGFHANVFSHVNFHTPLSFRTDRQFIVIQFITEHGEFKLFFNVMKTELMENQRRN